MVGLVRKGFEFWILDLGFCILCLPKRFGGYLVTFPTHTDPGRRIQESGCPKLMKKTCQDLLSVPGCPSASFALHAQLETCNKL